MSKPANVEMSEPNAKVTHVQNKVQALKDVMVSNIERVMERGEKLDRLGERAEDLQNEAGMFQRRAKEAKRQMWWQKCRMQIIIAIVLIILVLVIFVLACFTNGNNCVNKKK